MQEALLDERDALRRLVSATRNVNVGGKMGSEVFGMWFYINISSTLYRQATRYSMHQLVTKCNELCGGGERNYLTGEKFHSKKT